jgi:hypothetical protein
MNIAKRITQSLYRYFATVDAYLPEGHRAAVENMISEEIKNEPPPPHVHCEICFQNGRESMRKDLESLDDQP